MKAYQLVGINTAVYLLRPGAKWEYTGGIGFTKWDDPRPCPSIQEVFETIEKIQKFEDSINTILLPEQKAKMEKDLNNIQETYDAQANS